MRHLIGRVNLALAYASSARSVAEKTFLKDCPENGKLLLEKLKNAAK